MMSAQLPNVVLCVHTFGLGIANSEREARNIAKRQAVADLPLGFSNIHHTAVKCVAPKGDRT
jgi:hypothetical protein